MYVTLGILGPFLISNYQILQTEFLQYFTVFTGLGFADLALRIFLSLVAFLTALLLLATFFTWIILYNKLTSILVAAVLIYIFLWSVSLMALYGDADAETFDQIVRKVFANHLWLLVLSIPISLVVMMRQLLRDCVLTKTQMTYLSGIGAVLVGLNFLWLFGANNYDVLAQDIWEVQLAYLVMQGLLPLLAAVLALWTSNRIRHG